MLNQLTVDARMLHVCRLLFKDYFREAFALTFSSLVWLRVVCQEISRYCLGWNLMSTLRRLTPIWQLRQLVKQHRVSWSLWFFKPTPHLVWLEMGKSQGERWYVQRSQWPTAPRLHHVVERTLLHHLSAKNTHPTYLTEIFKLAVSINKHSERWITWLMGRWKTGQNSLVNANCRRIEH